MARSKKNSYRHRQRTIFSSLLSAWAISLCGGVPLLLLLAAIAYRSSDPRAGLSAYATVLLIALALSSGFFSARCYGKSGAFVGLLAGAGISLFLFCLGLALSDKSDLLSFRLLSLALLPILGLLGGQLGAVRQVRRRRPR